MLTLTLEMIDEERGLLIYTNRVYEVTMVLPVDREKATAERIKVRWWRDNDD